MRNAWCNRPAHERQLGFAEWVERRQGGADGGVGASQITTPQLQLGKVDGGRARHVTGTMNGLEKRYAAHLDVRKAVGEVADWKFEQLKLKLAMNTSWNPDFGLLMPDGKLALHEVKGHWEDDARVKIKWAAKDFGTWFAIVGVRWDKRAKVWMFEEFA